MVTLRRDRALGLAVAAFLLGGCATVEMSSADAVDSTLQAVDDAGIDADAVSHEGTLEGTHTVVASTSEGDITFVVDAGSGRFSAIDLEEDVDLSGRQLDVLADHEGNPADDRARTRRSIVGAIVVLVVVFGGLALARRARLREKGAAGHELDRV